MNYNSIHLVDRKELTYYTLLSYKNYIEQDKQNSPTVWLCDTQKGNRLQVLTYDHSNGFTYLQLGRDFINLF